MMVTAKKERRNIISMFACWFQQGLISQSTVFSSHNKSAPAEFISPETNQRTCRICKENNSIIDFYINEMTLLKKKECTCANAYMVVLITNEKKG